MQDEIAQGSYRSLIALLKQFGDHDAALTAYDGLIAVEARSLMRAVVPRVGVISTKTKANISSNWTAAMTRWPILRRRSRWRTVSRST